RTAPWIQVGARREIVDERLRLLAGQWLEHDRRGVSLPAGPCRTIVQELGPSETEHEYRSVERPIDHVLDQIEERRLGPVEIVEDEDQGPIAGQCFEEL